MRQPNLLVQPRPTLAVGQKVMFAETKRSWTVRSATTAGRFVVLTQPFNPQRTVFYTVVDFDRGIRGRDNFYSLGYTTPEEIAAAIHEFQHTEDGVRGGGAHVGGTCPEEFCRGGAEVSSRSSNHIRLDFISIDGKATDWAGRPTIDTEAKACPECVGGKHQNCTGSVPAGDDFDHLTDCLCAVAGHQETP